MEPSPLERLASAPEFNIGKFIPLHDRAVFEALVETGLSRLADADSGPGVVAVDSATAQVLAASIALLPPSITVTEIAHSSGAGKRPEFIFLCMAPAVLLTVVGEASGTVEEPGFLGGWSVKEGNAQGALKLLAATGALPEDRVSAWQSIGVPPDAELATLAMDLMGVHAKAQADRHASIAKDKADLFSVLAILKAISAKRRAHDILFVFVEHISKVVPSDRCSIVRIWGGDPHGHVMASHEDASVVDKTIELFKYPELNQSMATQHKILVNDALNPKNDEVFAKELRAANFNSLVVIPIVLYDQHVGSLLLRAARAEGNFSPREVSFFEIVAEAASNALERAQLFESIQVANERLERLAITDGLTGLYNHRHFRDHLQKEFERASRYKLPLSCMIFDVDDFKSLNDTYGHLAGDMVLKEIADRTQRCIRKSDLIARYGGEEFVIIMPQTGREGAEVQGGRICDVIGSTPFRDVSPERRVTVSGGVSILDHEKMLNEEDLLRAADQALYEAKRRGKNQVIVASDKGTT